MFRQFNKTRLAPTPSGFLHLGNVLSFSITAALARKSGAKIMLRIDDLDRARVNDKYIRDIFDTLHFLNIPFHEGPRNAGDFNNTWSQLHRTLRYDEALACLAEKKMVFACTCSRRDLYAFTDCPCKGKQIPLETINTAWRLITGGEPELIVKNYDGTQIRHILPAEMHNFVVRKKDGFPAYQLTSVIDDLFYGVDLVVRGQDLWPSTLAQHLLAGALGENQFGNISFFHHPLLTSPGGIKLSKSAGATSIKYLHQSGKSRAEIFGLIGGLITNHAKPTNCFELADLLLTG